jgi:hypothetical protein
VATGAAWLKAGTHREEEKNKTSLQERKTYLTLTGLLMEGLGAQSGADYCPKMAIPARAGRSPRGKRVFPFFHEATYYKSE